MKLIVIGVQRTGTNFFTQIIKDSYGTDIDVDVVETGDRAYMWKHSLPFEKGANSINFATPFRAMCDVKDLKVVLVSKHPLWWLSSIINRNSADLRTQRPGMYDSDGDVDIYYAVKFYLEFYRSWMSLLSSDSMLHVRYGDVLINPGVLIENVASSFGAKYFGNDNLDIENIKVPHSKGGYSERVETYGSSDYELTPDVLRRFKKCMDDGCLSILKELGYESI